MQFWNLKFILSAEKLRSELIQKKRRNLQLNVQPQGETKKVLAVFSRGK